MSNTRPKYQPKPRELIPGLEDASKVAAMPNPEPKVPLPEASIQFPSSSVSPLFPGLVFLASSSSQPCHISTCIKILPYKLACGVLPSYPRCGMCGCYSKPPDRRARGAHPADGVLVGKVGRRPRHIESHLSRVVCCMLWLVTCGPVSSMSLHDMVWCGGGRV